MTDRRLPVAILPRVGQFLRLLGSDQPGEVVAAAGALQRALIGAGVDLHDLAAAVEHSTLAEPKRAAARKPKKGKSARPRPAEPARRPPQPPPPPSKPLRTDLVQLSEERRAAILEGLGEAIDDAEGRLSDWQKSFAANLLDTIGRRRLRPTERQMQFIVDIVAIVQGEAP